ncbi:gluconolactonase [Sphingomonas gellani]|uniref:Gluconolactonase n=1 Tax=Sphingomonas gellani TaxID=1166340 RepID=A0A1H8DSC8_9SPHN|nr:SMP-30/gluconolactonase/LRE family protein [Sphingomonas gellani]SEN10231.1 gluconolactonase [Sphingomonas gellani]
MMQQIDRRSFLAGGMTLAASPALAMAETVAPVLDRLSPALDRIVAPGTRIETIAMGIRWAEGPVWVPGTGLLFSDPPANIVRRWTRQKGAVTFLNPSGAARFDPKLVREAGANGLALSRDGALLLANSGGRSIDRLDLRTRRRTMLADRYQGRRFNSPNDMHVARDGAILFTDPPYGLADGDASTLKEQPVNGVYRRAVNGTVTLLDGTLTRPNGIALSPNERRLFVSVSDEKNPHIMAYDLDARGMPIRFRVWLDARPMQRDGAPGLPDGMKIGPDGTHFCSVPGGMMILTAEAEPLGLIRSGGPIANCAFGEGGRTLFMTANDRVLRLPLARDYGRRS